MADNTADRLRDALRGVALPPAPPSLREAVEGFVDQPSGRFAVVPRTWWLAAAIPLILGLLAVLGSAFLGGSSPAETSSPGPTGTLSPTLATGLTRFSGHGITFEYPVEWTDYAPTVQPNYGTRALAWLVAGNTGCSSPLPTSEALVPHCVAQAGTTPGTFAFGVTELINPGPPLPVERGDPVVIDGHSGWVDTSEGNRMWMIEGEGGNFYLFQTRASQSDASWERQIDALLASVRFTVAEEPTPSILDDRFLFESPIGLSFTYPMGWIVYYPQTMGTMDGPLVLVASQPIEPCLDDKSCQFYTVPSGGIAVEFRLGRGITTPDWGRADDSIGGQPAFREDWTQPNAHDATIGHSWRVRFGDQTLGIYSSVAGGDVTALEAQLQELLATITLDPSQLPY